MAIIGGPSLNTATAAAPSDDMAATAVVRAARFRKERAMASGATRAAERKKRRALHKTATAVGPAPNQAAMPIPAATSTPSLVLETSTHATPSRTTAQSLTIILVPAATSAPRPAAASSPTKIPILAVVPILTIMDTPSPTTTSSLATGPSLAAALAARSTLSSGSTQSYQATSPCSGGRSIAVHATAFKKDRSRASAATRGAERKKKRALPPIQAAALGPTAKAIPATTSSWNPVIAPSKPVAFSRVDEMSPPNTPSFDVVLTLAATDQPKTTNGSTAQSNEVSRNTQLKS